MYSECVRYRGVRQLREYDPNLHGCVRVERVRRLRARSLHARSDEHASLWQLR